MLALKSIMLPALTSALRRSVDSKKNLKENFVLM